MEGKGLHGVGGEEGNLSAGKQLNVFQIFSSFLNLETVGEILRSAILLINLFRG